MTFSKSCALSCSADVRTGSHSKTLCSPSQTGSVTRHSNIHPIRVQTPKLWVIITATLFGLQQNPLINARRNLHLEVNLGGSVPEPQRIPNLTSLAVLRVLRPQRYQHQSPTWFCGCRIRFSNCKSDIGTRITSAPILSSQDDAPYLPFCADAWW